VPQLTPNTTIETGTELNPFYLSIIIISSSSRSGSSSSSKSNSNDNNSFNFIIALILNT
jgi:hypothetical protein